MLCFVIVIFAVWTKWLIRKLRFHHGGTWEEGVIGIVSTHTYKGGKLKDKLEVNGEVYLLSKTFGHGS